MLRTVRFPAATALLIGLPMAACQDLPSTPAVPESGRSNGRSAFPDIPDKAFGTGTRYVCYVSEQATDGGYNHGRLSIPFPTAMLAADGSTQLYRYRMVERGAPSGAKPLAAANCRIPNTAKAAEYMDHRLGVVRRRREDGGEDGQITTQGWPCPEDGRGCVLDGITVIGYPSGGGYNPGAPGLPGDNGYTGGSGGGGGGGGWDASYSYTYYTPPDNSYEPDVPQDPCKTGDAFLDSKMVSEGFTFLWSNSNVTDTNFQNRREQLAWIVKTATGYRIDYIGSGNFCTFATAVDGTYPPEGIDAIAGFIHTHPYKVGELIPTCDAEGRVSGFTEYKGLISEVDREASVTLGNLLGREGPLTGVVLDGDAIRLFTGKDEARDQAVNRCGY